MALERTDLGSVLPLAQSLALKLMGAVVPMMAVVAMAEYLSNIGNGTSGKKCRCGK